MNTFSDQVRCVYVCLEEDLFISLSISVRSFYINGNAESHFHGTRYGCANAHRDEYGVRVQEQHHVTTRTHARTHARTHIHTYTHTHTHTHAQREREREREIMNSSLGHIVVVVVESRDIFYTEPNLDLRDPDRRKMRQD